MQNIEILKFFLAKSHNEFCEILLLFSFCENAEKGRKKRENINYKQNVRKNILCKNIIIRKDILTDANFKISFETPYNYQVTIIPTLNNEQMVEFQTQINQK